MGKDSIYSGDIYNFQQTKADNFYFNDEDYTSDHYQSDKQLLVNSKLIDFVIFLSENKKIIENDYEENKIKYIYKPPLIINDIDIIINDMNSFGINKYTSEYVSQLAVPSIPSDRRKIVKSFLDRLLPSINIFKNEANKQRLKNLLLSNKLYGAIPRIYFSHQNMISNSVRCVLCRD
jgi:hypothetical protein